MNYLRKKVNDLEVVKIKCDTSEVKEAEQIIERLVGLLKEANTLVNELASKKIDLEVLI